MFIHMINFNININKIVKMYLKLTKLSFENLIYF